MPVGTLVFYGNGKKHITKGMADWDTGARTFKVMLTTSAYTPNTLTHSIKGDVTNEISAVGGYSAGGMTLPNTVITYDSGTGITTGDADDLELLASGAQIPAWRYFVIYVLGTIDTIVDPLVAYGLGNNAGIDVPATEVGSFLRFRWNNAGVFTVG